MWEHQWCWSFGGKHNPKFPHRIGRKSKGQFPTKHQNCGLCHHCQGARRCHSWIGETVQFRAHYFGNPEPRVVWIKNGARIIPDDRINVKTYSGESTLIIRDLRGDDSGKYEVLIENEVGNDAAAASLGVEGPPEPPAGRPYVSDIDNQTSSLTLAWYGSTFDGGSMVTGYVVEMSSWPITSDSRPPEATDWTVLGGHSHHTTSYIVKDLDPAREYIFRVKPRMYMDKVSRPGCQSRSVSVHPHRARQRRNPPAIKALLNLTDSKQARPGEVERLSI